MANNNSVRNLKKKAHKLYMSNRLFDAKNIYIPLCKSLPNDADCWINLAVIHRKLNELGDAEKCCKQILSINPNHAFALHTYASIFHKNNNIDSAIILYLKALQADKPVSETLYFIANAYRDIGDMKSAIFYYQKHLEIKPKHFETLNNISGLYTSVGLVGKAIEYLRMAEKIDPENNYIKNNLGRAYINIGDSEAASLIFKSLLKKNNYTLDVVSNYLMSLNYISGITPLHIFDEHKKWGQVFSASTQSSNDISTIEEAIRKSNDGKLKIGFVSPDLKDHPVSRFIKSFFKYHNTNKYEIFCYSDTHSPDEETKALAKLVKHWIPSNRLNDTELSSKIFRDKIDILIDLAGHTANNRMALFAKQTAPVQISYLGYPNTTGLNTVNYRITDNISDPENTTDDYYTEELIRLPGCFLAYTPDAPNARITERKHTEDSEIMFGSFNNLAKTTPEVIETWSKILHRFPNSRLTLKSRSSSDSSVISRYTQLFDNFDIPKNRLIFLDLAPDKIDHFECYNQIDIALDTFPYNGTTTTFEALWMGVPVVTLSGLTHVNRVGHSILSNLSIDDLIAESVEEYVSIAVALANNKQHLQDLQKTLRHRLEVSILFDYKTHTKAIENSLDKIWSLQKNSSV